MKLNESTQLLSAQIDGFAFVLQLSFGDSNNGNTGSKPTIHSAFLVTTSDLTIEDIEVGRKFEHPSAKKALDLSFDDGDNGSLSFNNLMVTENVVEGGNTRQSRISVLEFVETNLGAETDNAMREWVSSDWEESKPLEELRKTTKVKEDTHFRPINVKVGGKSVMATRCSPTYIRNEVEKIGLIAPISAYSFVHNIFSLCNGIGLRTEAPNIFPPLEFENVKGSNVPLHVAGATGYAMITHGVFSTGLNEAFPWRKFLGIDSDQLMDWGIERSYLSPGTGAPDNNWPNEILYLEGLRNQTGQLPGF